MTDQTTTESPGGGAVEAAKGVADRTAHRAGDVVGEATSQARAVAADAKSQARDLLDRGRRDLDQEANARSQQVAGSVRTLADRVGALAAGDPDGAGPLGDLLREGQDRLQTLAGRLDDGPAAVLDDLRHFARRQPVLFLAAAGGLGFLAGRFVRAARATDGDQVPPPAAFETGPPSPAPTAELAPQPGASLPAPELITDAPVPSGRAGDLPL